MQGAVRCGAVGVMRSPPLHNVRHHACAAHPLQTLEISQCRDQRLRCHLSYAVTGQVRYNSTDGRGSVETRGRGGEGQRGECCDAASMLEPIFTDEVVTPL